MKILQRPLHNIKSINYVIVIWFSVFMFIFISLAIPASLWSSILEAISFVFSSQFFEVQNLPIGKSNSLESTFIEQSFQNRNRLLNVLKVTLWIMGAILLLGFLFRNPKRNGQEETNK